MRDNTNVDIASTKNRREVVSVNHKQMRKVRLKKVNIGKGKKIGFFENVGLKIKGSCDGRQGFPRQTDNAEWYSPFMHQEVNSFEEFCSHTWGSLQIENEGEYSRLKELMDGINQKKALLAEARAELNLVSQTKTDQEAVRKKGEDKLTDVQVRARRKSEKEKKLAPLKKRMASLEQELKAAEEEFICLHSKLIEDDNTTRLICHRVRDHILMRLDVYWNSALRHHSKSSSMPIIPMIKLRDEAEETYLKPHEGLMMRAAAIYDAMQNEVEDKEVA